MLVTVKLNSAYAINLRELVRLRNWLRDPKGEKSVTFETGQTWYLNVEGKSLIWFGSSMRVSTLLRQIEKALKEIQETCN